MINEISQITEDSKCMCVVMESLSDPMSITPKMITVEPDEFVDRGFDEEESLTTRIVEACKAAGNVEVLSQHRTLPEGWSKFQYYNSVVDESEALANAVIYKNTKRFRPNFIMMSSDLLPVFVFTRHFEQNPCIRLNGIYIAGKYRNLPVLVSPTLDRGQMIWGVNETLSSGVVTFVNNEGKVCNKIVSPDHLVLIKFED